MPPRPGISGRLQQEQQQSAAIRPAASEQSESRGCFLHPCHLEEEFGGQRAPLRRNSGGTMRSRRARGQLLQARRLRSCQLSCSHAPALFSPRTGCTWLGSAGLKLVWAGKHPKSSSGGIVSLAELRKKILVYKKINELREYNVDTAPGADISFLSIPKPADEADTPSPSILHTNWGSTK